MDRYPNAAVLVGFTTPQQVRTNLTCLGEQPSAYVIEQAREIMAAAQTRLDQRGEVFIDETTWEQR